MRPKVLVRRMKFKPGLRPCSGDPVWMLPNGECTTKDPNGGTIKQWLTVAGVLRKKFFIRVGVIESAGQYEVDGTCTVILI
jgi:hypothetical protein